MSIHCTRTFPFMLTGEFFGNGPASRRFAGGLFSSSGRFLLIAPTWGRGTVTNSQPHRLREKINSEEKKIRKTANDTLNKLPNCNIVEIQYCSLVHFGW